MAVVYSGDGDYLIDYSSLTSDVVMVGTSSTLIEDKIATTPLTSLLGTVIISDIVISGKYASSKFGIFKGGVGESTLLVGDKNLTNYGKYLLVMSMFRNTVPSYFKLVLCTDDGSHTYQPTVDTENFSDLREIAQGNGYTRGGLRLNLDSIDFPLVTKDARTDTAYSQAKSLTFTAISGNMPKTGNAIYYAVLIDDLDKVVSYYEVSPSGIILTNGQSLSLQAFRVTLT